MDSKPWYTSKTLWVNAIGLCVMVYQMVTKTEVLMSVEVQAEILAVINVILRFVTKKPVTIS